jgi:hypothetical protein
MRIAHRAVCKVQLSQSFCWRLTSLQFIVWFWQEPLFNRYNTVSITKQTNHHQEHHEELRTSIEHLWSPIQTLQADRDQATVFLFQLSWNYRVFGTQDSTFFSSEKFSITLASTSSSCILWASQRSRQVRSAPVSRKAKKFSLLVTKGTQMPSPAAVSDSWLSCFRTFSSVCGDVIQGVTMKHWRNE